MDAIGKWLSQLWASIMSLFGTEKKQPQTETPVEKSARDQSQVSSSEPDVPEKLKPPAKDLVDHEFERMVGLARSNVIDHAEEIEHDQRLLSAYLDFPSEVIIAALSSVHWPSLVSAYSPRTLTKLQSDYSNLGFTSEINRSILDAASSEASTRLGGKAPSGHGMGSDGRQKRE